MVFYYPPSTTLEERETVCGYCNHWITAQGWSSLARYAGSCGWAVGSHLIVISIDSCCRSYFLDHCKSSLVKVKEPAAFEVIAGLTVFLRPVAVEWIALESNTLLITADIFSHFSALPVQSSGCQQQMAEEFFSSSSFKIIRGWCPQLLAYSELGPIQWITSELVKSIDLQHGLLRMSIDLHNSKEHLKDSTMKNGVQVECF